MSLPWSAPVDVPGYPELLRACLGKEADRWSGEDTLSVYASGLELLAWVNDERRYVQKFHQPAWRSAIEDLQYCLENLGTSLKGVIAPMRSDLDVTLQQFLRNPARPQREPLRRHLEKLLGLLSSTQAVAACWQDLVRACKRPEYSISKISKMRDEFWSTAKNCGHNTKELNALIKGILWNDLQSVYLTKFLLGENLTGFPANIRDRINVDASLSASDRISLCQRLVTAQPREARHVVWFFYTAARLNGGHVDVGPVQLYDAPRLHSLLSIRSSDVPTELQSADSEIVERFFRLDEDSAAVRVDLGVLAVSDAAGLARTQALAVLIAGARYASGREGAWKESGSHIHAMDGKIVSLVHARRREAPVTGFRLSPLAYGIDTSAAKMAAHLPLVSRPLAELVKSLDLWDQAKTLDATSSILVNVRLIELLSSYSSHEGWVRFCSHTFKGHWIWDRLIWELRSGLHQAAQGHSPHLSKEVRSAVDEMTGRIFENRDGLLHSDMELGLELLPDLARSYPQWELTGYQLRSLERDYSSWERLNQNRKALARRWDRALNRLERVRNALTHGGPVTDEALESVSSFSRKLAGGLLGTGLEAALDGKTITAAMTEVEELAKEWEENAPHSTTVNSLLFGVK